MTHRSRVLMETGSRARRWRALFSGLLGAPAMLLGSACAQPLLEPVQLPESCVAPERYHGQARVAHVFDGDTVRLEDGTRVRLIGLDTPEFHHRDPDRDKEPFAREAREALEALLAHHSHDVRLVYDQERRDRYQRSLAHLFTPDGQSISALMLAQGYATRLTIPPNDWNLDCYRDAERQAGASQLRMWSMPEQRLVRATELPREALGFHRIEGRVVRLGESVRASWINLEGDVALRIDHDDKQHFPGLDVSSLQNRLIRARGYVYNHQGQPRIRIRHPADLEILDE